MSKFTLINCSCYDPSRQKQELQLVDGTTLRGVLINNNISLDTTLCRINRTPITGLDQLIYPNDIITCVSTLLTGTREFIDRGKVKC